jgi:hypothetical protein
MLLRQACSWRVRQHTVLWQACTFPCCMQPCCCVVRLTHACEHVIMMNADQQQQPGTAGQLPSLLLLLLLTCSRGVSLVGLCCGSCEQYCADQASLSKLTTCSTSRAGNNPMCVQCAQSYALLEPCVLTVCVHCCFLWLHKRHQQKKIRIQLAWAHL